MSRRVVCSHRKQSSGGDEHVCGPLRRLLRVRLRRLDQKQPDTGREEFVGHVREARTTEPTRHQKRLR